MKTHAIVAPPAGAFPDALVPASALPDSKHFLQSTLDALSAHIAILDEHGTIIEVNAAWILFACDNGFIGGRHGLGDNYLKVCDSACGSSSEGAAAAAAGIRAVMAGQCGEFRLEYPCHSPHERRWFVLSAMRFAGEGPAGAVVAHENITERKRMEEMLHRSETKFRTLYESTKDAVMLIDEKGFFDCNPATLAMFGCASREEFCSKHPADLSPLVQPDGTDSLTLASQRIATAMEKGSLHFEWMYRRADTGETFPVEVLLSAMELDGKQVLQAAVRDIAELKRAARQLADYKQSEELARRTLEHEHKLFQNKSRFLTMVSHELRTPLSVIKIAAQLLDRYSDRLTGQERSGHFLGIQSAVERMTQMMDDFVHYEILDAGKMECKPSRVDVEALCRRLISAVANHAGAPCPIECAIDPAAREAFLDENILRHILGNLLGNAVKYSFAGQPVTLDVKRVAGDARTDGGKNAPLEDRIELKVSDSGIGIPAADISNLFLAFHRASNASNRPGNGMGLAIVKHCVDLHGGTIRVESEEGKGTTVWVWLPLASSGVAGSLPSAAGSERCGEL